MLRHSAATAQALLESASEGIVLATRDGRIEAVNAAVERMFGYPRADLIGRPLELLIPDRLRSTHASHREDYFATPRVRPMGRGLDLAGRRKDGSEFPVEVSLSFVETADGPLAMAFVTDITERKQAERRFNAEFVITRVLAESVSLREATPRLLQAMCECLDWHLAELWRVDPVGPVLRWEALGRTGDMDITGFEAARRGSTLPPGIGTLGRAWAEGDSVWVANLATDGQSQGLELAAGLGLASACAVPVGTGRDVAGVLVFFSRVPRWPDEPMIRMMADFGMRVGQYVAHRQAHEELGRQREVLHQNEKLAALGTLAAGLAHEINNPIGIIASRLELLLSEPDAQALPTQVREDLAVIQRNVQRVGRIAHGLLSFARQSPGRREPVNLNRVVGETLLLMEAPLARRGIAVVTALDPALPTVLGDAGGLQQVVLNLLTNARDALEGRQGEVSIRTQPVPGPPRSIRLVVTDTGPGMEPGVLARIFDPFFTTKPHGTGLGLSVSYGIVRDHQGTLEVESAPGRGTTFTLALPVGPG
jgi:PAS domain S-box-containing protein